MAVPMEMEMRMRRQNKDCGTCLINICAINCKLVCLSSFNVFLFFASLLRFNNFLQRRLVDGFFRAGREYIQQASSSEHFIGRLGEEKGKKGKNSWQGREF